MRMKDNSKAVLTALKQAKTRALREIGSAAVAHARARCPVGTGPTRGTLRASITSTVRGDTLSVGSRVAYAPYVELGTGARRDTPSGGGMAARPYLLPAMTEHADEYRRILERQLRG